MRRAFASLGAVLLGALPMVALVGTLPLALWADLRLPEFFWASAAHPSGSPPWHFIGSDLVEAVVDLVHLAFVLTVSVCCAWIPACSRFAWMAAWQVVLFDATDVLWGGIILGRTRNIWDASRATTDWATFDQYLHDPLRMWLFWLALVCAAPFFALHVRQMRQADPPDGRRE
jgi:hypothetical protein